MTSYLILALACIVPTIAQSVTTIPTTLVPSTIASSTISSSSYAPTQPGLAADCDDFYLVKSGDTCASIEAKYDITTTEFHIWNPAINSTCSNLYLDYWVCVGVPDATTTTTATITPTPTPTTSSTATPTPTSPTPQMPGIVSGCTEYYLVETGDTCETIDAASGITQADFLLWNTDVDAYCDNLWLGYYVCVGV